VGRLRDHEGGRDAGLGFSLLRSFAVRGGVVCDTRLICGLAFPASDATPIWRSSWRAMASASPPFKPLIFPANSVSIISVPSFVPSLSSMPELIVAWRIDFISSCMNSDSNCLATSLIASFGSLAALLRRLAS
jgi:hypothetical protein